MGYYPGMSQRRANPNDRYALTYGPAWEETKRRYFSRWWCRKRCFWCRTKGKKGNRIQLNHLTYARGDRPFFWQVKPLCARCHKVETWLTRWRRPHMDHRGLIQQRTAHFVVTYVVRWCINLAVLLPFVIAYVRIF